MNSSWNAGTAGSVVQSKGDMRRSFTIRFLDRALTVEAPESIAGDIAAFFRLTADGGDADAGHQTAVVGEQDPGRFALQLDGKPLAADLARGDLLHRLNDIAGRELSFARRGIPLNAAAVSWEGKTILILGAERGGKSHLAAWLVENGFAYVADSEVSLLDDTGTLAGFGAPLSFPEHPISHVGALPTFRNVASVAGGKQRLLIRPEPDWHAGTGEQPCGLIMLVKFVPGAALHMEPLPKSEAPLRVLEATRKVVIPSDPQYPPIARLAESTPALRLTYGGFPKIEGVLDFLVRATLASEATPAEFDRFLAGLSIPPVPAAKVFPIPARSERKLTPKLTIGMATYDDYDGAYFSIQAIRMYHPEILDEVEFLVVDNHPDGPCGGPLKKLEELIPNYRYVPFGEAVGTASARNQVFVEAAGTFVLCIDSHVFIVPGALRRLLDYFARNPETGDLLQGPIIYDDLKTISTNYLPEWKAGFLGVWGDDPAGADPEFHHSRFACRAWAFLPAGVRRGWDFIPAFAASAARKGISTRNTGAPVTVRCACPFCAGCTASNGRWVCLFRTCGWTVSATI